MNLRYFFVFTLFSIISSSVSAITPRQAADSILNNNKILLSARNEQMAKDLDTRSMTNLPDPDIEGDYMVAPAGVDNRWGVGVNYEIEWPGVYSARKKTARYARESNRMNVMALEHDTHMDILDAIWAYLYAERRLDLLRNVSSATDSVRELSDKALKGGEISRLDQSKIAIEQSRIQSLIANVENELVNAKGRLKVLNGGDSCDKLLDSIDYDWIMTPLNDVSYYMLSVLANNKPDVLKAAVDEMNADAQLKLAKAERFPGFKVGYAHEYEDGMHFNGANIGISVPIFSSRNKVKAAKALNNAAKLNAEVVVQNEAFKVAAIYEEIIALDKALAVPTQIFKNTDYADMLMKAYKGGELSLTEYLLELSWFYEAHLEFMDLQYQRESKLNQIQIFHQDI